MNKILKIIIALQVIVIILLIVTFISFDRNIRALKNQNNTLELQLSIYRQEN